MAVARPRQHEMIAGLISASDAVANSAAMAMALQVYPVANVDGKTFVETLNKLFENTKPKPQISFDSGSGQLMALATAKQHDQVRAMLFQMQSVDQEFELFHLQTLDPFTAQSAIDGLFRDEPKKSMPKVDVDFNNGTLLISASPEQFLKIRQLLIKLGESEAGLAGKKSDERFMRVVPVNTDVDQVLQQLETIWPKLQKNELRVIRPEGTAPESVPHAPAPQKIDSSSHSPRSVPWQSEELQPVSFLTAQETAGSQDERAPQRQTDKAPVLVIPGKGKITIASSDPQALDELEKILNLITGPNASSLDLGNFQTFQLRHAGADQVVAILKDLFDKKPGSQQQQRTSNVPLLVAADDRLNMVILHAGRSDREIIGNLIQVLDSPDVTDALSINQPVVVAVRNTDANRLLTILNSVFRTQLSSGGGRKQIPIPEGLPVELASLLQQVNVATSGPLLTLGVDTVTNSIIVLAPPQLRDQVKATIVQLDEAVETEPGEQIEIIQLRKTNTTRIQRALDNLFKEKK
jgi:type II secretory pathway component GspD/PulD (secretin)